MKLRDFNNLFWCYNSTVETFLSIIVIQKQCLKQGTRKTAESFIFIFILNIYFNLEYLF